MDEATELRLRQPHFRHVVANKKQVDGRVFFPSLRNLKAGCTIKYTLGQEFVFKRLTSLQEYKCFRDMLRTEGLRQCLPNAKDLDKAVDMYHKLKANGKDYKTLAKKYGVVALRLGDVTCAPYRPLSRTEVSILGKILQSKKRAQWLSRIARGSFANVFKFKEFEGLLSTMQMSDKPKLEVKLKNTAVRILKGGLTKTVRSYEIRATNKSLQLPWHPHILREQKLAPGITTSKLYDESLKSFIQSRLPMYPRRRDALECVSSVLVNAVAHMHKYQLGHFDIKPSNILIKWVVRGHFKNAEVVLADFDLSRELHNGWYTQHAQNVYMHHTHIYRVTRT